MKAPLWAFENQRKNQCNVRLNKQKTGATYNIVIGRKSIETDVTSCLTDVTSATLDFIMLQFYVSLSLNIFYIDIAVVVFWLGLGWRSDRHLEIG